MRRLAFATYSAAPGLDPDDALALPALEARGFAVSPVPWDAPASTPEALRRAGFDALVLRSCWNYHRAEGAFTRWLVSLEEQGFPTHNPPSLARWNLSKGYLAELAARGIPTPRTLLLPAGHQGSLAAYLEAHALDEVVVKPLVSMNGWDTWRASRSTAAALEPEWRALVSARPTLVQPYLREIEEGELSFVFFRGEFSHALRKVPRAGEFRVQYEYGGRREHFSPDATLLAQARAVLDAAPRATTYARVDGVLRDGVLWLMELEALDPTLYFAVAPEAAERFAAALDLELRS